MDPITAAIVSALAAGLADVGKEGIRDAYQGLKSLLYRKFGPQSSVFKAVEDLESNPSSPARKAVLQEEVAQSRADRDPELLRTANYVIQKVRYPSSMKQSGTGNMQVQEAQQILAASGQGNTLAGRNIINGRPGVVAFVSIVLVAIFAFVLWQIPPFES